MTQYPTQSYNDPVLTREVDTEGDNGGDAYNNNRLEREVHRGREVERRERKISNDRG